MTVSRRRRLVNRWERFVEGNDSNFRLLGQLETLTIRFTISCQSYITNLPLTSLLIARCARNSTQLKRVQIFSNFARFAAPRLFASIDRINDIFVGQGFLSESQSYVGYDRSEWLWEELDKTPLRLRTIVINPNAGEPIHPSLLFGTFTVCRRRE